MADDELHPGVADEELGVVHVGVMTDGWVGSWGSSRGGASLLGSDDVVDSEVVGSEVVGLDG